MHKIIILLIFCFLLFGCVTHNKMSQDANYYYLTVKIPKEPKPIHRSIFIKDNINKPIFIEELPSTYLVNMSSRNINYNNISIPIGIALDLRYKNNRDMVKSNSFKSYLERNNFSISVSGRRKIVWVVKDA